MKENVKTAVTQILTNYLETNNLRRTPERFAVLDAIYSMNGQFTLEQLDESLIGRNFRVCRATLYNTMQLFLKLRLVVRHRLQGRTLYEACYAARSHCYRVCTICGSATLVRSPEINEAVENTHIRRFHKDTFIIYIYGVCSTCLAMQTRLRRKMEKSK